MNGKDSRDKGAAPKSAGHLPQNQEERDDRRGVEQDIGQMMSAGMQVRTTGSPACGKARSTGASWRRGPGERPDDPLSVRPRGDHRVVIHIIIVVVSQ